MPRALVRNLGQTVKNAIINGNFDFWHRGTSFTASAANYNVYTADRFAIGKDTTPLAVVVSQSTDIPTFLQSKFQSRYSLLVTNNASGNTPSTGDGLFLTTRLEGQDYQSLHGKKVRAQFWVKSSVTGTYSFILSNKVAAGTVRAYASTYTVNVANTWEKKTFDITMDDTGVWAFDNALGLCLMWTLACGAAVQTSTLNAWQSSGPVIEGATGQVNWTGTANSTFRIAQVSLYALETGAGADLPFERAGRTIQDELAMCQRYYYTGTNGAITGLTDANAGLSTGGSSAGVQVPVVKFNGGNAMCSPIFFPVTMRTIPSIYVSDGTTLNKIFSAAVSASTAGSTNQTPPSNTTVTTNYWFYVSGGHTFPNAGDLSTLGMFSFNFVANAEL